MPSRSSILAVVAALSCAACKDKAPPPKSSAPSYDAAAVAAPPPADAPTPQSGAELAHLRSWDGTPTEQALAVATSCDKGDAAACYRLGNLYEEGMGTDHDMARAHALHARACEAGRGEACRILGALLFYDSGPPADRPRANDYMARACKLGFLDACHVLGVRLLSGDSPRVAEAVPFLARGCQRGYGSACRALDSYREQIVGSGVAFPSVDTLPLADLPVPSPEAACPPLHHLTTSTGGGARLNGGLTQVPHEQLLAAIPNALPGWKRSGDHSSPAGRAGTRSSYGAVDFAAGDAHLSITVTDNFMNCTLQPRTGEMATAQPAQPGTTREVVDVAGHPAIAIGSTDNSALVLWLADRCTVFVSAVPPMSSSELVAAAHAVDLDALSTACAQRDYGFL